LIKERFDLSGKRVLIVGGRGYLGARIGAALDEFGARVFSADLPAASRAASSAGEFETPATIRQFDVDVSNAASARKLVEDAEREAQGIDVLFYCATAKPKDFYAPFTECSLEGWRNVFAAEMDGLFLIAQRVGALMERQGHGNIVLLASMYGVVGNDQRIYEGSNLAELYAGSAGAKRIYSHAAYPAVKGGVIALTRYLAAYWEGRNIRVNCLSPGGIEHPGENEAFVKKYADHVPLGRKAKPEEICSAAVFLASEASSYLNGHNLIVDGGWTAW
jgi:NAD(P)-dependent dehydrogenase (short-subunit alcohol dehydrogenase family)